MLLTHDSKSEWFRVSEYESDENLMTDTDIFVFRLGIMTFLMYDRYENATV
jgi:hypothetical protein